MVFDNLLEFVEALEPIGELKRVNVEVNPDLEIAEIMRRLMYSGKSPALLFESVKGFDIPILGNAFGSLKRLQIALDLQDFTEIGKRIVDLTKLKMPSGVLNKIRMLPKLSEISEYGPKIVDKGPIQEKINTINPSFNDFPILKSFIKDAGRFITFGMTVTKHPETGIRNIGVYRIQIVNNKKAIMHWQTHKRGAQHFEISKDSQKPIQACSSYRVRPRYFIFSSIAPVPKVWINFYSLEYREKRALNL